MTLKLRRAKITDKKLDLPTYNTMMEWIERLANMETDQYFSLDKSAPNFVLGLRKFGGSSTVNYSDFAFGMTTFSSYVRVHNPCIQHDEYLYVYNNNYTDVEVTGGDAYNPHYIMAKYTRKQAFSIEPVSYASRPIPDTAYYWIPIGTAYLDASGLATVKARFVTSMIFFSGEI